MSEIAPFGISKPDSRVDLTPTETIPEEAVIGHITFTFSGTIPITSSYSNIDALTDLQEIKRTLEMLTSNVVGSLIPSDSVKEMKL